MQNLIKTLISELTMVLYRISYYQINFCNTYNIHPRFVVEIEQLHSLVLHKLVGLHNFIVQNSKHGLYPKFKSFFSFILCHHAIVIGIQPQLYDFICGVTIVWNILLHVMHSYAHEQSRHLIIHVFAQFCTLLKSYVCVCVYVFAQQCTQKLKRKANPQYLSRCTLIRVSSCSCRFHIFLSYVHGNL